MANGTRGRHRDEEDAPAATAAERPSTRAFWSGTITFGLVSIPVELHPALRRGRSGLRLIGPSGTPLRRRYFDAAGKEVSPEHLVRGFEIAPGEHVVVTDEELEGLEPRRSRDIDLTRFVPVEQVDPVLFERAWFLAPSGESTKAYRLLAAVMEETGRAGIATFVMRGKEYLVAILARGGVLRAETLRFADEVRSAADVGLPERTEPSATSLRRWERAIAAHGKTRLDPDELEDPWEAKLEALAARKRKRGNDVVEVSAEAAAEGEMAEVVDLMEILKRSLAGESKPKRARGGR